MTRNLNKYVAIAFAVLLIVAMTATAADARGNGNGKGKGKSKPAPTQPTPTPVPEAPSAGNSIVLVNGIYNQTELMATDTLIVTENYVNSTGSAIVDFVNADGLTFLGEDVPEDVLDLSAVDANSTVSGDQAFVLVDEFSGTAGELTAGLLDGTGYSAQYTSVRGDIDGDGVADFKISVGVDTLGLSMAGPWADNIIF